MQREFGKIFTKLLMILVLSSCNTGWNKNDDNRIYIPGRNFYFLVSYHDSTGELQKTEKLILQVTNGFYPERKQTQIVWELYEVENGDTTIYKDKTGVVDSKEYFFIHQPRIRDMYILSFADFPAISKAVISDSTEERISKGTVTMAKSYMGKTITNVNTYSEYQGKTTLTLPSLGKMRVHRVVARATSELGTFHEEFFFQENLGFVKLAFTLPKQNQITIELTATDF